MNLICKGLVSRVARKQEFDERGWVFEKLPFPLGIFFDENNVVTLFVDNEDSLSFEVVIYFAVFCEHLFFQYVSNDVKTEVL